MYALGHELAQTPARKFDLDHMRVLLAAMEHPERKLRSVLIAGTNGKGSTAAALASILQASGLRTGFYSSPHLVRINERIRIDGHEIADERFALLHDLVERTAERLVEDGELPWHPSFFEMLTAIAFEHFATGRLDIAVLEVGMGGRLDATNVVDPLVSVITDISLDHEKFLGNTVGEIAREKAGIIRRNAILVTLPQSPEANNVIGEVALAQDARAVSAADYVPPISPASPRWDRSASGESSAGRTSGPADPDGISASRAVGDLVPISRYPLQVCGKPIMIETSLVGRHQLRNIALAVGTAVELGKQGFPVTAESIERGIRRARWPGRFQVVPGQGDAPEFILDVAHNPAGAWALRSTLSSYCEARRLIFVFGAMRDKSIREIAEVLFPLAEIVIATSADNPRSATSEEIREAAKRTGTEIEAAADVASAIDRAKHLATAGQSRAGAVIVVTGSIYIVGEAMRILGVRPDAG
jgi:dihydrofolate synthase/folylpolyglutamate synthase